MKKHVFIFLVVLSSFVTYAQTGRGPKIGYFDMEYILKSVPEYAEANHQIEQNAIKWKQDIDSKNNEINALVEVLKRERVLLTKELIEEKEEEIAFLQKELSDYQQKRFGPLGDYFTQKSVLAKPIQDQVFTIVQDLAEAQKYDFIFDKSSDLTMVFAAKKFDISELIIRKITRSSKQGQLTKKQAKQAEEQDKLEDLQSDPDYIEKQQAKDEKLAEREKKLEERKQQIQQKKEEQQRLREEKIKERQEQREKLLKEREEKKNKNQK